MKVVGTILVVLGVLFLASAGMNAPKAPNVSYLIGTLLPGLLCLIVGLKLRQPKKPKDGSPPDGGTAEPGAAADRGGV